MPIKKKLLTNREAVDFHFNEILRVIDIKHLNFVDNLDGEQKRDFQKFCSETYHNPFFFQIINNFIVGQVLLTAEKGVTDEHYWNGKLICQGIKMLEDFYRKNAFEYDNSVGPEEPFDPRASFNKAKI